MEITKAVPQAILWSIPHEHILYGNRHPLRLTSSPQKYAKPRAIYSYRKITSVNLLLSFNL